MTSALKDLTKKTNAVRRGFNKLTNNSVDVDQSTNQSTSAANFKSFAHIESSSEEICGIIEELMNANCSKFAMAKTIQKISSSSSSKEIDLTLNHLSMSENMENEDPRNMTTSMLHMTTTTTPRKSMLQPQAEFALKFLPPMRSESENELRQLIDQCVEEKNKVETALATLDGCLAKIKENQEKIESLKKEGAKNAGKGFKAEGESAAIKSKIKKIEKEILVLKQKEKECDREEAALRKKLTEFERRPSSSWENDNTANEMRESGTTKDQLESRLQIIEALSESNVKDQS